MEKISKPDNSFDITLASKKYYLLFSNNVNSSYLINLSYDFNVLKSKISKISAISSDQKKINALSFEKQLLLVHELIQGKLDENFLDSPDDKVGGKYSANKQMGYAVINHLDFKVLKDLSKSGSINISSTTNGYLSASELRNKSNNLYLVGNVSKIKVFVPKSFIPPTFIFTF
jgi:hypothetical protein